MTSQAAKKVALPPRRPRSNALPTKAVDVQASDATHADKRPLPPRRPRSKALPTRAVAVTVDKSAFKPARQPELAAFVPERAVPAATVLPPKKSRRRPGMITHFTSTAMSLAVVAGALGVVTMKAKDPDGSKTISFLEETFNPKAVANPYLTQAVDALKLPTLQKAVAAIRTHDASALPEFSAETLNMAGIAGVLDIAKMWAGLPQDIRTADVAIGNNLGLLLERMDEVERLDAKYQTQPYQSYAAQYYRHASSIEITEIREAKARRELAALEARIAQAHSTKTAATCSFEHTRVPSLDQCDSVLETLPRGYRIMVEFKARGAATRTAVLTNPDAFAPDTAETIESLVVKQGPWARFGL